MSGDQLINDTSQDLESVLANDELLDILRSEPEFAINQYGDLDIVLEKLRNGLTEFVSGFVAEDVSFELSNVAIYSDEEQFSALGTTASFVNFHSKRGELILCVGLGAVSFRRILKNLLGGAAKGEAGSSTLKLTSAENILFQRFSKRLCLAYNKILGLKMKEYDAVETDFKILNKLAKEVELIVLTYQISFSDTKFLISVLTTLDQLEPANPGNLQTAPNAAKNTLSNIWSQKLSRKIDELEVPVFAQLTEKTMNLVDVAQIEKGTMLDIEFELNDICVTDPEENNLFVADMEIRGSEILFRVTGSPPNPGGRG